MDNTRFILQKYKEKYPEIINLVLREKNIGPTPNVYDLIMKAKGKYIAFLEGDDYWNEPNKLEKQVSFLENNCEYIGTAHDYIMKDNEGNVYPHRKMIGEYTRTHYKFGKLPGQTATLCFRNFFHDKKDDYEVIKTASSNIGDRTIVLLMLLHGKVYCFPEKMSTYRVFSSSNAWSAKLGKKSKEINPYLDELQYYIYLTNYSKEIWGIKQSALCNKSYCVYASIKRYFCDKNIENKRIMKECILQYDESRGMLFFCFLYLLFRDLLKR